MGVEVPRGRAPRRWWLVAVVAVVAVVVLVWVLVSSRVPMTPPTATASPGSTAAPLSTPTAGSPQPAGTPSPAPSPTPLVPPATPGATAGPPPPRVTQEPIALDEVASASAEIRIALTSIEAVTGVARVAGEVSGPALRVTVEATNGADAAFATPAAAVNLYFGADRRPANMIQEPGGRPLPMEVPADGAATGIYVFSVPEDARDDIVVEIELQVGEPIVLFEGAVTP